MAFLSALGVGQGVLPPQPRPDVAALRALGFRGTDTKVIEQAARGDGPLLRACSSASSMWTANAATVAPSSDTYDGRLNVTVANLSAMFHRSLEAKTTFAVLNAVFADPEHFAVHPPLAAGEHFSDEGAANHTRLFTAEGTVHVFGWGRSGFDPVLPAHRHPRRQTREASAAVARLNSLKDSLAMPWEQEALGIDAGAFHTDVLAVGNEGLLLLHEHAFAHHRDLLSELKRRLGAGFQYVVAHESELPAAEAVTAYPFNSQLCTVQNGMAIVAPAEARDSEACRRFLDRVLAEDNPVSAIHYVDVNASMNNGGGPACLRLRVPMTDEEQGAIKARVFVDAALHAELVRWVERHYRDRMAVEDLADPALLTEVRTALDELTGILRLGVIYDFQQP